MNKIKRYYYRIPTISEYLAKFEKQFPKGGAIIGGLLLLIVLAFGYFLPTWANGTLDMVLMSTFITSLINLVFFLMTAREVGESEFLKSPRTQQWIKNGWTFLVCLFSVLAFTPVLFSTIMPANPTKSVDHAPKNNTTYVTYSPTCEYCKASHSALAQAVNAYNITHNKQVVLVNIDQSNKLTKGLSEALTYKGMVVSYDKNGNAITQVYTKADKSGNPIGNKASDIYTQLQQTPKLRK